MGNFEILCIIISPIFFLLLIYVTSNVLIDLTIDRYMYIFCIESGKIFRYNICMGTGIVR